jgi:hypothetical protein
VAKRLKSYKGDDCDIIIGPVANDDAMPTIQAYIGKFLSQEAALAALKAKKLVDQVCLKSEKAISRLRFIRAYESGG